MYEKELMNNGFKHYIYLYPAWQCWNLNLATKNSLKEQLGSNLMNIKFVKICKKAMVFNE